MKHLNKNTKKAQSFIRQYYNSNAVNLYDVYERSSTAKNVAFYHCELTRQAWDGRDRRIISYNTFQFTYAFLSKDGKTLFVITKENIYHITL